MSISCIKCGRENLRDYPVCTRCEWVHFTDRADCRCSGETCSTRRAQALATAEAQHGYALALAEAITEPTLRAAAEMTALYYGAEVLKYGEVEKHMACYPDDCGHVIQDETRWALMNQNLI